MKNYQKPELKAVEISLCNVILTSVEQPVDEPGFTLSGNRSAGEGNWDHSWDDILRSM